MEDNGGAGKRKEKLTDAQKKEKKEQDLQNNITFSVEAHLEFYRDKHKEMDEETSTKNMRELLAASLKPRKEK
ncbi:hypothetical protein CFC21_034884 [Triticum aestivum]|uniref:Uncharacterized protein n=4 Tax=Triticum TaxID=4564 RepID=M7Z1C8_TRIUA|nr:hypothetical protein TRIUR3_20254 [Triticum urartu]EMS53261.1 hypothetical protein TRIUR3_22820 [Triticum urartu]KAF7022039.1 hypothetical protein CFC21_034884 [Triticum aestivum]VAH59494.1 unnamed protein product [Triticum turgidum subsp. durum]